MIDINPKIRGREDIERFVTHEEIFRFYISNFRRIGDVFCSELRQDKTPSAGIFHGKNELVYRDFATGDTYDVFNYVMVKYGISYFDALRKVYLDLCVGDRTEEVDKPVQNVKSGVNVQIKSRQWQNHDIEFWSRYGIKQSTLDLFNVKPISYYWIGDYRFIADEYAYAYCYYDNSYKIYQPYSEEKWFSNARGVIQGYNQLPNEGELLIITSSLKDIMSLFEIGYSAIAASSETSFISKDKFNKLNNRFTKIILYLNNDVPGINAALKFSEQYNIPFIYNPIGKPKDPSDWVKIGEVDELKNFLLTIA
jgi:hypothetical protein